MLRAMEKLSADAKGRGLTTPIFDTELAAHKSERRGSANRDLLRLPACAAPPAPEYANLPKDNVRSARKDCAGSRHTSPLRSASRRFRRAPGPRIKNPVGRSHDVGIVLDDKNRVPQIPEVMKDFDQPVRIAGAGTDTTAHPARRACPRAATPAKSLTVSAVPHHPTSRRQPVERQILQPHVIQKAQPLADFPATACRQSPDSCGVNSSSEKNRNASSTVSAQISQIFRSLILTCRASSRSRDPLHAEHNEYPRYRLRNTRTCSLYFLKNRAEQASKKVRRETDLSENDRPAPPIRSPEIK